MDVPKAMHWCDGRITGWMSAVISDDVRMLCSGGRKQIKRLSFLCLLFFAFLCLGLGTTFIVLSIY